MIRIQAAIGKSSCGLTRKREERGEGEVSDGDQHPCSCVEVFHLQVRKSKTRWEGRGVGRMGLKKIRTTYRSLYKRATYYRDRLRAPVNRMPYDAISRAFVRGSRGGRRTAELVHTRPITKNSQKGRPQVVSSLPSSPLDAFLEDMRP